MVAAVPGTPGAASSNTVYYPPRIVSNRRQVDDRFPSLGFLVDTGGRPFFEVLVTTDASLFDPGATARRTATTFFSSRQPGGLLPASQADHPYLLPSAVLRGFATATPRPRAVYYTLISYTDANGGGPAFALDPAKLATAAPSVSLAGDFTGRTLATVLSVSVDKLARYSGLDGTPVPPSAREDAGEGEDGYGLVPPIVAATAVAPATNAPEHVEPQQPDLRAPAAAQGFMADGDYELAVLPGPEGAARRNRPRQVDPLLPGQTPMRQASPRRADLGFAQGEDFDRDSEVPEYLEADDDNGEPFTQSLSAPATLLEPRRAGYLSLDEDERAATTARPLTVDDKMRIIDRIAPFESGGDYGAINADGEFEGKFGTSHPAYQRFHIGLSYGLIQFTQESGKLGELLVAMRDRDPDAFAQTFGPDAGELIRVTTATGPASSQSPDGRSARTQPVAGADLWREPWVSRFHAAGQNERFRAAQREIAARSYLDPMLQFAGRLGLDSERALTMVVDRAIQMGPGGAKRWIVGAIGPIASDAMRQQALAALGFSDLRSFQASVPGLAADGEWGPESHAALVAALRGLGASSPVPIPTLDQMVQTLVRRAASEPWHARTESLAQADIPDNHFAL